MPASRLPLNIKLRYDSAVPTSVFAAKCFAGSGWYGKAQAVHALLAGSVVGCVVLGWHLCAMLAEAWLSVPQQQPSTVCCCIVDCTFCRRVMHASVGGWGLLRVFGYLCMLLLAVEP